MMRSWMCFLFSRKHGVACQCILTLFILFGCVTSAVVAIDWSAVPYTRFEEMQAVGADGSPTWQVPTVPPDDAQAYRLVGVVVNNPEEMLDSTPAYAPNGPIWNMGGQWQIGIQAVDTVQTPGELLGDAGGALLWVGQNYGNHVWHFPDASYSYTDSEWLDEMSRLNYPLDEATGEPVNDPLRKGDLIEVRARGGLAYRGKFNVNEQHDNDPAYDFDIVLLARDVAVEPIPLTLSDVKDTANLEYFDPNRQSGGELYQARYVQLEDVQVLDASGWGRYGRITVSDGEGRTFPVRLGVSSCWDTSSVPVGTFDLVGLFDQDSSSGKDGYQMWTFGLHEFLLDADANADGFVGSADLDIVRANWGGSGPDGDVSRDGLVGSADLDLVRANWGFGIRPNPAAVPEPCFVPFVLGILAGLALRRPARH